MNIFKLNDYEEVLKFYKDNDYTITNFKDLDKLYKSNVDLPKKYILLRNDIHARDIDNAYNMIKLEHKYFKKNIATYFFQWKLIGNSDYETDYEKKCA